MKALLVPAPGPEEPAAGSGECEQDLPAGPALGPLPVVEGPVVAPSRKRDQQRGAARVQVDRPGHRAVLGQAREPAEYFGQGGDSRHGHDRRTRRPWVHRTYDWLDQPLMKGSE